MSTVASRTFRSTPGRDALRDLDRDRRSADARQAPARRGPNCSRSAASPPASSPIRRRRTRHRRHLRRPAHAHLLPL